LPVIVIVIFRSSLPQVSELAYPLGIIFAIYNYNYY